jgi:hypothetical protein
MAQLLDFFYEVLTKGTNSVLLHAISVFSVQCSVDSVQ